MDQTRWDQAYDQAVKIMAKVTAGVTHEIKNKLAVLQEQGSLMQELAQKAAAKGPLDHDRVDRLAGKLVERVRETDEIIRRLNRFAHSADQTHGCLEAGEALFLMMDMYRRLADMKPVSLRAQRTERSINVETRPMFLLAALFACLDAAVAAAPVDGEVRGVVVEGGPEVRYEFFWEGSDPARSELSGEVLAVLGARMEPLAPGPGLSLTLPAKYRCGLPEER